MALETGTQLGTFEITGPLGAGGMGEVYRATDTQLGREVAIKTLPSSVATDQERLARFEREAKLLATLNHAHIAAVYSLDEHDGTRYLAMELVEGETLEQKLKGGALPVDVALQYALQIAEALEAAHEKGVVHRDLKPANVMVTPDGVVKVLDFGLAKAFSGNPNEASPAHSPALSLAMTQAGLVLGTAGYMSPEQASGQATDQRADIWAFGVVVYEMLTGLPVFSGESVPHVLAAVLQVEPDWSRLPENLHPRLRFMLERCLTKKPRDRYHSIADARVDIESVLSDSTGITVRSAQGTETHRSKMRLVVAAIIGGLIVGLASFAFRPESGPAPVTRFLHTLPSSQLLRNTGRPAIAISSDGRRFVYNTQEGLFLRTMGEPQARLIPGTEVALTSPTFSPNGRELAYWDGQLKRIALDGGPPVFIADIAVNPFGVSWNPDGTILIGQPEGILRVSENGGTPELIIPAQEGEQLHGPTLLPDGDSVLFSVASSPDRDSGRIVAQSMSTGERTLLWEGGWDARYLPTGHLVYAIASSIFAVAFDPERKVVSGGAVPLVQGVMRGVNTGAAQYSVSDDGTLVYLPGPGAGSQVRVETTLTWVDRDGREEPLPIRPDDYTAARISPDGTKVALVLGYTFESDSRPNSIWIFDLETGSLSLLTSDSTGGDGPVWSSDGSRIYFRSLQADPNSVYAIEVDTGETTLVASAPELGIPLPWTISPDDRLLGLVVATNATNPDLAMLSLEDGQLTPLLNDQELAEFEPSISPNGAWIAYEQITSDGAPEINIRPFPDVARTRIPVGPGQHSVFSPDGSELFFFDGRGLVTATIDYEPALRIGMPQRLFESSAYLWEGLGRAWDVDPNGERFLMIRNPSVAAGQEPARVQIHVVLNWFTELRARVSED